MLDKKSRIFVAGAYGFIGYNLTNKLLKEGYKVYGNRFSNKHLKHIHKNYKETSFNLEDKASCIKALKNIDVVFMCAAATSGAYDILNNPLYHVTSNIRMLLNLLEASIKQKIKKFVFISTGCVYPNIKKNKYSENDMLKGNPFDVYYSAGWTKRYSEILCQIFSTRVSKNFSCLIVRPSNIFGPYDKFDKLKSHVTASIIRKVYEDHNPLVIWGNGEQKRDLIFIDDFINGLIEVSKKIFDFLEVNIASGKLHSINEILKFATDLKKTTPKIVYDVHKPKTVDKIKFDISKIQKIIGFKCQFSVQEGIKKTFNWIEQNKKEAFKR